MHLKKIRHQEMRLKQKKMPLYSQLKFYHEEMCLKVKLLLALIFFGIRDLYLIPEVGRITN